MCVLLQMNFNQFLKVGTARTQKNVVKSILNDYSVTCDLSMPFVREKSCKKLVDILRKFCCNARKKGRKYIHKKNDYFRMLWFKEII